MLKAAGHPLFFYSKASTIAADRMEIDFLIPKRTLNRKHNICPVEVKSDRYTRLTSLRKYLDKYPEHLGTPFVLHDAPLKVENGVVFLPLYMMPFCPVNRTMIPKRKLRRHHPKRRFSFCFRPSVRTPYRPFPP